MSLFLDTRLHPYCAHAFNLYIHIVHMCTQGLPFAATLLIFLWKGDHKYNPLTETLAAAGAKALLQER